MSTLAVARKDFQDAIRSRWLWALTALFVLFAAGIAYLYQTVFAQAPGEPITGLGLLFFLLAPAGLLIPIIGLMVGYKSLVGERESGSLKLLLSLPHSRRDAVLGKLLGRSTAVTASILVGFLAALAIVVATYSEFDPVAYALFVLLSVAFAVVYIAVGVGISAFTSTTSRALAAAVGFIVVFEFLWENLVIVLGYVVDTIQGEQFQLQTYVVCPPDWAAFLNGLAPGAAYGNAATALLPANPRQFAGGGAGPGGGGCPGGESVFLQDWFGLVILALWFAVPLALGYWRFDGADL